MHAVALGLLSNEAPGASFADQGLMLRHPCSPAQAKIYVGVKPLYLFHISFFEMKNDHVEPLLCVPTTAGEAFSWIHFVEFELGFLAWPVFLHDFAAMQYSGCRRCRTPF